MGSIDREAAQKELALIPAGPESDINYATGIALSVVHDERHRIAAVAGELVVRGRLDRDAFEELMRTTRWR